MGEVLHIKSPVDLRPILPANIEDVIHDAVRLLEPAVRRQSHNVSMDHIVYDLRNGLSLLWLAYVDGTAVAAVVTCIVKQPLRRNMKIEWMAGKNMHLWGSEALSILTKVAKDAKLDAIETDARKGFTKYAEAASFREMYTHFELELS
tara:strand:- start:1810 stop:2253 length:444 start_codon:yes stop_codon:yes gene_type:complete